MHSGHRLVVGSADGFLTRAIKALIGHDNRKIHGSGNDHEGDDGVHEVTDHEFAAVDFERNGRKIRLLDNCGDKWGQQVLDEGGNDGTEGYADNY
jgi:hypothetical protein